MKQLFATHSFVDFGPDRLHPFAPPARLKCIRGSRPARLREQLRQSCPKRPGVYGMVDRHGELIYVGKAKVLRNRLLGYFRPRSRDPKAGVILRHTTAIVWEISPNEFAALHRELELIRRWRPRFNVQGQPNSRQPISICLGRAPAPYAFLSRQPPPTALCTFGPIGGGRRAREAVRWLNTHFGLRDCPQSQPMHFAEQNQLFAVEHSAGCLRLEIATCMGPCAGGCTRADYYKRVGIVESFLSGANQKPLNEIRQEMIAASARQQYERAAALRDKFVVLTWLYDQLEQMRRLRRDGSFVYPMRDHNEREVWYLIHAGRTVAAISAPTTGFEKGRAAELIERIYSDKPGCEGKQSLGQRERVLLVAAWFRRYPEEKKRLMKPEHILAKLKSVH